MFNFKFDPKKSGDGIEISKKGTQIFLDEKGYKFKTILGDKPLYSGIYYWEVIPDYRSEFFLKVGVTKNSDFDMNTSFSDF